MTRTIEGVVEMFRSARTHILTACVATVTAAVVAGPPAIAHIASPGHTWKKHFQKLADARYAQKGALATSDGGSPNGGSNMVHWDVLSGVPAGFADGVDDSGGASNDLSCTGCVSAGELDFNPDTRYWMTSGNPGTGASHFVGTTDNQPLNFRVNNARVLRFEPNVASPNVIGGFSGNDAGAAVGGTVGGGGEAGAENMVSDNYGTVAGGRNNDAGDADGDATDASSATVGGGNSNVATANFATVGGGFSNDATGAGATVGGGEDNAAVGLATVGGGLTNIASGNASTVGGGFTNTAGGGGATLSGGQNNTAGGQFATIGGGFGNTASAYAGTVAGGGRTIALDTTTGNMVVDDWGTVGGGGNNNAGLTDGNATNQPYATVAGGRDNNAIGGYAAVSGGTSNTASGLGAVIGGGESNIASGPSATVPGGSSNTASGGFSFAGGHQAIADDEGAFVWADSLGGAGTITSPAQNSFTVRASGRFFLENDSTIDDQAGFLNTDTGGYLSTGGAWTDSSSREVKENFSSVDGREILQRVAELPVSTWNYEGQDATVRHIGPVAEDFYATFGVGEDERHIAALDTGGVALAAIQGLHEENSGLRAQVSALEDRIGDLSGSRSVPTESGMPLSSAIPIALVVFAAGMSLVGRRTSGSLEGLWPSS